MNKVLSHIELTKIFADLLTNQKVEATKYFLPNIFYRVNHSIMYNAWELKQAWIGTVRDIKKRKNKNPLKFYIHIPFCRKKCNFCFYYSATSFPKSEIINHYIKRTCNEMNFYKDVFSDVEFKSFEIRGGSPSILSEGQLNGLLANLFKNFHFSQEVGERSFECNPHEMTPQKFKILKKFGFTDLSFGVQSLDPKILKYANRGYQTYDLVKRSILNAQYYGFKIKVDLMVGLYKDNAKSFVRSFGKIAKFGPKIIAMNPLHPTGMYLKRYFGNNESLFYSELEKKISQVMKFIKPIADKFGYAYDDKIYLHRWQCVGFRKEEKEARNIPVESSTGFDSFSSVFGIGYNSVSKIIGFARYQNTSTFLNDFSPQEKYYNFFFCGLKDDMRDYILEHFAKREYISQKDFKRIFKKNLLDAFSYPFFALKKLKKIKIEKDKIYFLPKDSKEMFIYSLFFWDKDELAKTIRELINIRANYQFNK